MKQILPIIFLALVSCSGPDSPAEASSSEDPKSPSAPATPVSPAAKSKSPIFDPTACKFLTEAQIKQTLGDRITDVSFQTPISHEKSCQKPFTLTLANGNSLKLLFKIAPSSVKGVEKLISEYTDNAKGIPGLIKMEKAPDGQSHIGTHISQRRLYVFRSGQESVITLTYDVRGEAGGQTPEEVEARRQMGLSLIAEMLKE